MPETLFPARHIARQADVLMRALAHVGIAALVDEATGYQEVRDRRPFKRFLRSTSRMNGQNGHALFLRIFISSCSGLRECLIRQAINLENPVTSATGRMT